MQTPFPARRDPAASKLAAVTFDTVSDLLSDTTLGYSGASQVVSTGDIISAGGFRYEVAASGASDEHVTTAGGVKLYVKQGERGFNALAFGLSESNTAAANDTALESLWDAAGTENVMYIPAGSYSVSLPTSAYRAMWVGDGLGSGSGSGGATIFEVDDSTWAATDAFITFPSWFEGIKVNLSSEVGIAVDLKNNTSGFIGYITMKNFMITGAKKALNLDAVFFVSLEDYRIESNFHGLYCEPADGAGDDGYVTTVYSKNGVYDLNTGYGIYFNPALKSPVIDFVGTTVQRCGTDASVDAMMLMDSNCSPYSFRGLYLEGGSASKPAVIAEGDGRFENVYENSEGGIQIGTGSSRLLFSGLKETATSPGLSGGSAVVRVEFWGSTLQAEAPTSGWVRYKNSIVNGVEYTDHITGTLADVDWSDVDEMVLPPVSGRRRSTAGAVPPLSQVTDEFPIAVDGSTTDIMTFTLPDANDVGSVVLNYSIKCFDGGFVTRQSATGLIKVAAHNTAGTVTGSVTSDVVKNLASGTMSDPTFSISISGTTVTLRVANTSSQTSARITLDPVSVLGAGSPTTVTVN